MGSLSASRAAASSLAAQDSRSRRRAIQGSWSARCAGVVGPRGQGRVDGADQGQLGLGVAGLLLGRVDDVDDLGVAELAEGEAEVQRRADDHDQVGLGLQQAPGPAEGQLVVGGQAAPAQAVDEGRHPQVLDGSPQVVPRPVPVDVGAGDDRRAFGLGDQAGGLGHVLEHLLPHVGVAQLQLLGLAVGEDDVQRQVGEHRAPVRGQGDPDQLVDLVGDPVHVLERPRVLGDRLEDRDVVELLQAPGAPAGLRGPAAQHHQRRAVEVGRGHRARSRW